METAKHCAHQAQFRSVGWARLQQAALCLGCGAGTSANIISAAVKLVNARIDLVLQTVLLRRPSRASDICCMFARNAVHLCKFQVEVF